MRVLRFLALAAVAGLVGAATGCSTTVSGRGVFADGTGLPTPSGTPPDTASPTASPASPTPTPTPSPTIDPLKMKRQITCVLVQANVKSVNDRFNAAKSRNAQITILRSGVSTIDASLRRSQLPKADGVYTAGGRISAELRTLVTSASRGGQPSTVPYNTATTRFRKLCMSL